ncbi:MAG: putative 4-mercaptohistidine N1-methyltransferase [Verrucomicrobia bacterium]|nr:putative 4-mercaptohistidine N1-methyltransferase [Verrucomicrobiota bacterium]MDA1068794.1 putative 4-mercaptohistidine N1-methyltransferase [Verrucomicrobiota bacterium]
MPDTPFYETDKAVSEYLLFHYGSADEILPYANGPVSALNYPVRCVVECVDSGILSNDARALDLGCAVGRSSFELARLCTSVLGIDYSHRFIEAADLLKASGSIRYHRADEGALVTELEARIPEGLDASSVTFQQADATALPDDLGTFDVILAANLIDRLIQPMAFLNALPKLMNPGGQLVITSPYTWLEEYTPKENWLGGYEAESGVVRTIDGLEAALSKHFVKVRVLDLPFLIREHARKFQWSVAQGSVWIRKSDS